MTACRSSLIEALADPQERFEALRERTLLASGRDLVDLSYANPEGGPRPAVRQLLHDAIDRDRSLSLQYTPYGGATIPRRLVAHSLHASHDAGFRWRHVVLTPGAMAALNVVLRSLVTESGGDEVVVPVPCWLDYPLYLANLGLVARMVPLTTKSFDLDVDAIAAALGPKTRAVMISQPGNPTGRVYSAERLKELASVLENSPTRPLLISDECHRDVIFEPARFESPLRHYDRCCVIYSFGKSHLIQGQRTGYVAVSPKMENAEAVAASLARWCRIQGFCTPTALMQNAIRDLLKLRPDTDELAGRRERAIEVLIGAGVDLTPSDASFFLYPSAGTDDDFDLVERLAARDVLVLPSSLFHHRGHFRISLTCSDAALDRGLETIADVLGRKQPA